MRAIPTCAILEKEPGPVVVVSFDEYEPRERSRKAHRLYCRPGDHITRIMEGSQRFYEQDLLTRLRRDAPGGVYIDVGAFMGTHTVAFADHFPSSAVVALEPDHKSYEFLVWNVATATRGEKPIMPLRAACGASGDYGMVVGAHVLAANQHNAGMNRVSTNCKADGSTVAVVTIDELRAVIREHVCEDRIGLIKIDVEGMEKAVLAGAKKVIAEERPVIVIEAIGPPDRWAVDNALEPLRYTREGPFCATPTYIYWP